MVNPTQQRRIQLVSRNDSGLSIHLDRLLGLDLLLLYGLLLRRGGLDRRRFPRWDFDGLFDLQNLLAVKSHLR